MGVSLKFARHVRRIAVSVLVVAFATIIPAVSNARPLTRCPLDPPVRTWKEHFTDEKFGGGAYIVFDDTNPAIPPGRPWRNACVKYGVMPKNWHFKDGRVHIRLTAYLNNWHSRYYLSAPEYGPPAGNNVRWVPGNKSHYQPVSLVHAIPNPKEWELAVWQDIFKYNNAGEVFFRGKKVGMLSCTAPSPTAPCLRGKVGGATGFW